MVILENLDIIIKIMAIFFIIAFKLQNMGKGIDFRQAT